MALIIASIFIGFLIVVSVIVSRLPSHIIRYWICPKCEKPTRQAGDNEHLCSVCNVPLERLDGFYERHPELI